MTSDAHASAPLARIINICEKEKDQGGSVRDSAEITGKIFYFPNSHRKTQINNTVRAAYMCKSARTDLVCCRDDAK